MATLGALTYKLTMDHTDFTKGTMTTRRELKMSRQLMVQAKTAAQAFGESKRELSRLLKKGAIDQKTYRRSVKQLRGELKAAKGASAGFGKSLGGIGGGLGKAAMAAGAFIASLLAVRKAVQAVGESMAAMDKTAKTASKLGMATDELVALRLAAAEFSGLSANTVDIALQRMTRRVSEAALGTGTAVKALKELGLDAAKLKAVGPAESFRLISESIKNVESEADQLRLAFALFDSDGAGLVTTLRKGREGLDAQAKAAKRLGMTFSEVDAQKIEAANDAIGRVGSAMEGVVNKLAIGLAPGLEGVANELTELIINLSELPAIFDTSLGAGSEAVGWFEGILQQTNSLIGEHWTKPGHKNPPKIQGVHEAAQLARERVLDLDDALREVSQGDEAGATNAFGFLLSSIDDAAEGSEELKKTFKTALGLDVVKLSRGGAGQALVEVKEALRNVADEAERASLAKTIFGEAGGSAMIATMSAFDRVRELIGEAGDAGSETAEILKTLKIDPERLAGLETNEALKAISTAVARTGDKTTQTRILLKLFGDDAQHLMNLFEGGAKSIESLGRSMEGVNTETTAAQIGLSVDALNELRAAAFELRGVAAGDIDDSLKSMVTSIVAAGDPSRKIAKDFETLGLSVTSLAKMDPGEAFKTIADSVRGLPGTNEKDKTQARAIVRRVFGESSAEFHHVLNVGRSNIERFGKDVSKIKAESLDFESIAFGAAVARGMRPNFDNVRDEFNRLFGNLKKNASAIGKGIEEGLPDPAAFGRVFTDPFKNIAKRNKENAQEVAKTQKQFADQLLKEQVKSLGLGQYEEQVELMKRTKLMSEEEVEGLRAQAKELDQIVGKKKEIKALDEDHLVTGREAGAGDFARILNLQKKIAHRAREKPIAVDVQGPAAEAAKAPGAAKDKREEILAGIKTTLDEINSKDLLTIAVAEGVS